MALATASDPAADAYIKIFVLKQTTDEQMHEMTDARRRECKQRKILQQHLKLHTSSGRLRWRRRSGAEQDNCQKSAKRPMRMVIGQMATEGIDLFRESRRENR